MLSLEPAGDAVFSPARMGRAMTDIENVLRLEPRHFGRHGRPRA